MFDSRWLDQSRLRVQGIGTETFPMLIAYSLTEDGPRTRSPPPTARRCPQDATGSTSKPADAGRGPGRRGIPQGEPADPRGSAGDRIFEPLLCRGRRGLHDRPRADRRRHTASPRWCRSPSSSPATGSRRSATTIPCAQASSSPAPASRGSGCASAPAVFLRPDRGDRRPDRRRARTDQRRGRPHQPRRLLRRTRAPQRRDRASRA